MKPFSSRKLLAGCLALLSGLLMLGAPQALAARYQQESYQTLLGQVNGGEVKTATLSRKKSTVKVKLASRRRFVATFPANAESQLVSNLRAHGARVKVARLGGGAKSSSHIRYRFIALAILVLGALAALGYYLLRGRPSGGADAAADSGAAPAASASGTDRKPGEPPGEGRGPPEPPPGPGAERT